MTKRCLAWACAGVVAAATLACSGRAPVWNGTWKLNVSKSTIPGPSFVLTLSPSGEYHVEDGEYSFSLRCDGKEYSTVPKQTLSCIQQSASVIDTTTKEDGKTLSTWHLELSADGKTLAGKRTSVQADRAVKTTEAVYSRTTKSMGFAGGWRDTQRLETRPPMLLTLDQQGLHLSVPATGEHMDPPLDGSDAPIRGPGVSQGLTMAVRPHGRREFLTVKKAGGKIVNEGSLRLSWDGRTLVEEYWSPSAPKEKATLVYDKQ